MEKLNKEDFKLVTEDKEDYKNSVMSRSNITTEFKLHDIEQHQKQLKQAQTEIDAQNKVAIATCKNIEANHKWITKLSDERIFQAWMYKENADITKDAEPKLKEIANQLKQYDELLDILHEVGGFVKVNMEADAEKSGKETKE